MELNELSVPNTPISSLDVSQNTKLEQIACSSTNISELDISSNTMLKRLFVSGTNISNIDLSSNIDLELLSMSFNNINTLDVSNNVNLDILNVRFTNITSLDLSQNTLLTHIECNNNELTSLNLKNGNNTAVEFIDMSNNPNLLCVEVDDPVYSTANWTMVDSQVSFSEDCSLGIETLEQMQISFYPNPVDEILFFETPNNIQQITIYNNLGMIVGKTKSTFVDVSHLRAASYFIKVEFDNNSSIIKQIIKE